MKWKIVNISIYNEKCDLLQLFSEINLVPNLL